MLSRIETCGRGAATWLVRLAPAALVCACVATASTTPPDPPAESSASEQPGAPRVATAGSQRRPLPRRLPRCERLTITGARLYVDPQAEALENVTLQMQGGVIVDLTRVSTDEPALTDRAQSVANQCIVNAEGHVVTAGFWNTHVHFTDPVLTDDGQAAALIDEMLLSRGFTSVLDTGADPRVIDRLRTAIEVGTMLGPRIVVAGGSFVYTNGTPAYLPKGLLPELTEPAHAGPAVERVLDAGADGIKIFSGSFQTPSHTIYLPGDVIAAITNAAHARGAFVVSHPTDRQGLLNAVDNGVDILAHTAPPAGVLELDLLTRMRDRKVALTPTLKIWRWELERHGVPASAVESYITRGVAQLRDYHALGGEVLFGTDVGYMLDYDPTEEYVLMARAGLDFRAILQTLTVNPGARFARPGTPAGVGTVAVGQAADLVVLAGDPAADVRAFATPLVTIRGGQLVSDRR